MLNLDPELMGMLGMSLMNQANNPNFNIMQTIGILNSSLFDKPSSVESNNETPTDNRNNQPMFPVTNTNTNPEQKGILDQLRAAAVSAYPDNPLMQQVALTQAIHESGALGKGSELASKYNNYFGIKSKNGVSMPTQEYYGNAPATVNQGFAVNPNMESSFIQYKNLLSKPRYQAVDMAQTPSEAFSALQKAGYATDPRYAQKLNAIYNRYVSPLYL